MADGKVIIETGLDLNGIKAGLKKLGGVAKTGIGATTKVIAGASAALTGMGGYALKVGSDFEAGMSEVQAISGAAGKDLQALKDKAKEMGATTKFSATESAEALKYMAMAGWKTQQMTAGLPGIMNLAAASGESLANVSDIVTDALTAFNLKAEDSAHFADVLAKASSNSNTNVGMMGATFKYVAPIAGAMKYSIEDTAVAIGLMANAGIKGEQAGTSLRSMLTRLVKPPADAAAALKKLGVSAQNQDGSMKPLSETLAQLREKFADLDDSQKAEYAASIAGQEAMSGLLAIVNASPEDYAKLTAAINDSEGAAKDMADTMNDNLQGQITILKSSLEGLGIEIYENVDNPLTDAAKSAIDSVGKITKAFKKNGFEGMAKEMGTVMADGVVSISKQAPKMVKAGSKMVKAFVSGVMKNRKEIVKAAGDTVKAFAGGIADLFPTQVGNAFKSLDSSATKATEIGLSGLGIALKGVAGALNLVAPVLPSVIGGFLALKAVNKISGMLKVMTTAWKAATAAVAAHDAAQRITTVTTLGGLSAMETAAALYTGKITLATAAQGLFNKALTLMGGPTGMIIAAIGAATAGILAFASSLDNSSNSSSKHAKEIKKLTEETKEMIKAYEDSKKAREEAYESSEAEAGALDYLGKELETLAKKNNKTNVEKAKMAALVDELNDKIPDLNLTYDKEKDKLNKSTKAIRDNIEARKNQILAAAAQEQMAAAAKDMVKAEQEIANEKEKVAKKQQEVNDLQAEYDNMKGRLRTSPKKKEALKELNKEKDTLEAYTDRLEAHQKTWSDANKEFSDYSNLVGKYSSLDQVKEDLTKVAEEAKIKAKDIPAGIAEGIAEASYSMPQTGEELKNLISFDGLVQEAKEKGFEIPPAIAEQVAMGGENVGLAVDALSTYITNQETLNAASKEKGIEITNDLKEGILSGKYGVVKSVKDVEALIEFESSAKKAGKAGSKTIEQLTKKIKAGKLKPADAIKEVQALVDFQDLYNSSGAAGKKSMAKLKAGIESGEKLPSKALEEASRAAVKAGEKEAKKSDSIGKNVDEGAAGGIGTKFLTKVKGWAESALAAAKEKLGIKSPSKRFKNEVGKMMVAGVVAGINSEKNKLLSTTSGLMSSTVNAAKQAATTGNFADIGKNFTASFTSKIDARQTSEANSLKKTLENKQKSIVTADKKEEQALEKKIKKSSGKQKKAYQAELKALKKKHKSEQSAAKSASSKILKAYESALKQESQKLIDQAEKNIEELSNTYQAKYDELIQKREAMRDKLMDIGDLLISKTGNLSGLNEVNSGNPMAALNRNVKALEKYQKNITAIKGKIPDDLMEEILKMGVSDANSYMNKLLKMEDGKFDEYVSKWKSEQATVKALEDQYLNTNTLGSLQGDIDQMRQYQNGLNSLKGRIPESMMEEILGMGVNDANAYMQQLLALSNTQFATYVEQWRQKEALANSISTEFFAQDIQTIQTNYSNAINTEMSKLKTQMNNLGKNVGKAFASGLKSQSKKSKKAIKDICNTVIKQCKKSLGIKSPSRVFKEIGKLSMVGAEVGTEKEAKQLYKTTDKVAQTYADRFAAAKLDAGAMYAKMQAAVVAEQSRVPASVQTQIVKLQAQQPERSEQRVVYEIHVHADMDKREMGKALATITDEELGKIAKRKERR